MIVAPKRLNVFERYLSLWVGLCMLVGVVLGKTVPAMMDGLRGLEFGAGSQINIPIAILIWLMITPMMMKVDFGAIRDVGRRPRGLAVTLFVNWLVKPFSMAMLAWLFFRYLFSPWIAAADADQYIAGTIILAAAPCTAMVFVWSYLSDGDPAYTLVQVSVNDLLMLVLFASWHFDAQYRAGELELELVPQGTLAERIRAAGAGIGAFFTPTAYGTKLAEGKETRRIGERDYVLEYPLHADYALVKADRADRWGNLTYRKTARNFGPIMAAAARCTVVQVRETVELGELDPEHVVTPGIFVKRVVKH